MAIFSYHYLVVSRMGIKVNLNYIKKQIKGNSVVREYTKRTKMEI